MANTEKQPVLPSPFVAGATARAADMEAMRQAVAFALGSMIGSGPGILISKRGGKFLISAENQNGGGGTYKTFYARKNGTADVVVSAGAMGSVVVPETTITAPTDGDLIWLWVEIDAGGIVTDAEVRSGSSIPADTETEGHKPLASVAVASSIATPTPVSWNWTDVQVCAGVWLWGGIPA